jgi:hypothetical protein
MVGRRAYGRAAERTPALAQKTVVGVTDTEIKIGQSVAFSGPASVYGQISTAEIT